ncbi:MAG TPA: hypothetical protein VMV18_09285, partial [bacterium]|nr:hypothetical protein [bacterium]
MGSARTLILAAVACAAVAVAASRAHAHTFTSPKHDAVRVEPGRVSVTVDYLVPPAEAFELRRIWDLDRDGRVRGHERDAAISWLVLAASHFVELSVDGKPVPLQEDLSQRALEGVEDAVSSSSEIRVSLVLAAKVALDPGEHHLGISDRHKDASIPV